MNKKLLVVAVAGALAPPGVALAQSSVTISGIFKASLENLRIGSPTVGASTTAAPGSAAAGGRTGLNTTENRIADDSSRILFNVVEDLGGGLQAIGQADLRMPMASGNLVAMSGNTHVGLRSSSLGRIFVGRQDLHYGNTESDMSVLAGDLRADAVSIISYTGGGGVAIAGATRTPNVIHYTTPNFSGFTAIVAYSTGPLATGLATGQVSQGAVAHRVEPAERPLERHPQGQRDQHQPELRRLELPGWLQLLELEAGRWQPRGHAGQRRPEVEQALRLVQDGRFQGGLGLGQDHAHAGWWRGERH